MSRYFPKPYKTYGWNINVKVNLSNYATQTYLKNATGVDTSKLAGIGFHIFKTVSVELNKLSNVVNNEVVKNEKKKKNVYDKLVAKVNNIDTSGFLLKTKCCTDKSDLEKKLVMHIKKTLI